MNTCNVIKMILLTAACLVLAGCGSTFIKKYPGKLLPISEVGTVTCESAIQVTAIDGDRNYRLYSGGGLYYQDCTISLMPGQHSITYKYYMSSSVMTTQTNEVTHTVNIEKGKLYRIKYTSEGRRWRPWIEELTGEELKKQRENLLLRIKNKDA